MKHASWWLCCLTSFASGAVVFSTLAGAQGATKRPADRPPTDAEAVDWGRQLAKSPELLGIEIASLQKKISTLQNQLGALERRKTNTVTAPFTVVDQQGKARFRVGISADQQLTMVLYNDKGEAGIGMRTNGVESQIALFAKDGDKLLTLGSHAKGAGLTVAQADGSKFAQIDSNDGLMLSGKDGKALAQVSLTGTEGAIDFYNAASGKSVARLRTSEAGSGRFTLADADGTITLDAGTTPSGVGLIKLGPDGNGPAATMGNMGLPASKLEGRKGKK
jgi:hypothetical protein